MATAVAPIEGGHFRSPRASVHVAHGNPSVRLRAITFPADKVVGDPPAVRRSLLPEVQDLLDLELRRARTAVGEIAQPVCWRRWRSSMLSFPLPSSGLGRRWRRLQQSRRRRRPSSGLRVELLLVQCHCSCAQWRKPGGPRLLLLLLLLLPLVAAVTVAPLLLMLRRRRRRPIERRWQRRRARATSSGVGSGGGDGQGASLSRFGRPFEVVAVVAVAATTEMGRGRARATPVAFGWVEAAAAASLHTCIAEISSSSAIQVVLIVVVVVAVVVVVVIVVLVTITIIIILMPLRRGQLFLLAGRIGRARHFRDHVVRVRFLRLHTRPTCTILKSCAVRLFLIASDSIFGIRYFSVKVRAVFQYLHKAGRNDSWPYTVHDNSYWPSPEVLTLFIGLRHSSKYWSFKMYTRVQEVCFGFGVNELTFEVFFVVPVRDRSLTELKDPLIVNYRRDVLRVDIIV